CCIEEVRQMCLLKTTLHLVNKRQ
ncbi:hypothetical protein VEx25_0614, partial [Vibrio antiquarius]